MHAGTIVLELILSNSLKANHIGNQQVAAKLFGEMRAVQNCGSRNRADTLRVQFFGGTAARKTHIIPSATRSVSNKLIAPLIKAVSVRIRPNRKLKFNIKAQGIELEHPARAAAKSNGWPPGRFKVFIMEDPSGKVKSAAGAHHKTVGGVMCICRIYPMKHPFSHITDVISIQVFQKEDIGRHCDQHAAIPEFEPGWIVQTIGKGDTAVSLTVAIIVGQNQQFVVHLAKWIPVRICWPCSNP